MYLPPGPCRNDFLILNEAISCSSTLSGSKLVARELSTSGLCWSTTAASNSLPPLVAKIQQGEWIQHVANTTRSRSVLGQDFMTGLMHVRTSNGRRFLGFDRLPVSCTSILPFHSSSPSPIAKPYVRANRGCLPTLIYGCNWGCFLLANYERMKPDKLYSLLHECLASIMPEQTQSVPKKSSLDRLG